MPTHIRRIKTGSHNTTKTITVKTKPKASKPKKKK
jgi:hypothetical protein